MNGLDSLTETPSARPPAAPNGFSELTSESFMKIIFTELSKQDPLEPNDSGKLLEQLSSIRNIQADVDMSSKLESIVTQNQLSSAAGMIGKLVSGVSDRNERVIGRVASVSRTGEGPALNLSTGERVLMDNVDEIVEPAGDNGENQ